MVRDAVLRTAPHHEVQICCAAKRSDLILRSARSARLERWLRPLRCSVCWPARKRLRKRLARHHPRPATRSSFMTRRPAQALAVRDGKIVAIALGRYSLRWPVSSTPRDRLGSPASFPGLIDSHLHAIRAGLSFTTGVHWIGARTLTRAPSAASAPRPATSTERLPGLLWPAAGPNGSSSEDPPPDPGRDRGRGAAIITSISSRLYSRVLLDPVGADALGLAGNQGLASRLTIGRDSAGQPTGWLTANRAIQICFDLLPRPTRGAEGRRARGRTFAHSMPSPSPACSIPATTTLDPTIISRCFRSGASMG